MFSSKSGMKAPTWDLDSIFPGGSESAEYARFRENIRRELKAAGEQFDRLPEELDDSSRTLWIEYILKLQEIMQHVHDAESFAQCLISQNVNDEKAHQICGEVDVFNSEFEKLKVLFESFAKSQADQEWAKLVSGGELKRVEFYLNEVRDTARLKMEPEFESLAADLAVNGYHAWNRLYDKMYGDLSVDYSENGKKKKLSLSQLANKMSSPDRKIRRRAFEKLEEAWETRASLASMVLNFQAGFRLTLYSRRKWDSFLLEPLLICRLKEESLEAMWSAVETAGPKLNQYIDAKKKILGIDRFRWYDQTAPIGASHRIYSFGEAGDLIVEKLGEFSAEQADFTRMALDKRWVEAENRSGKAGGAFHSSFITSKQSRILMTFEGSFDNLSTLAHELGHAYHRRILRDAPFFSTIYPMNLAETASIFNELLVTDAALAKTTEKDEKLMLLDQKLQNAYVLFCNLYARFLFDKAFYSERKRGLVSRARLDELMVDAQKKAFVGTLADDGFHPLFWASKLHFYLTGQPFYNYPYTFGYLFSSGVYNRAKEEGPSFAKDYQALLADTGRMTSEEVAMKHMGADLTRSDFWLEAVNRCLSDVEPFVRLAEEART